MKKNCKKEFENYPNLHNDLLCGSQDIISVQPIRRSIAIATYVLNTPELKLLFEKESSSSIWQLLLQGKYKALKDQIDHYLFHFGERCIGELKLETISYSQDPAQFIQIIQSYVQQNITTQTHSNSIEDEIRIKAESIVAKQLKGKHIKQLWFNYLKNKARDLVSNRENLRYERTRGFGMVRQMFTALGTYWHQKGWIAASKDIFYIELAEIKTMLNKDENYFKKNILPSIEKRKEEFENYRNQSPPMERFFTYGNDFSDAYIYSTEKLLRAESDLTGVGCCPGIVEGEAVVVHHPKDIDHLKGGILVTTSTDPGWVTLFPTASAIIVERGSLLSHSAIVSREMGIPCIVGITGLLRSIKTGDKIRIDGSAGIVKKLEECNS